MKYYNPEQVISPKDFVENIKVIFDGGENSYSLAILDWEGEENFAIRWNVARREWDNDDKKNEQIRCVGMPSSHGYPVWFILPKDLLDKKSEIWKIIEKHL